MATLTTTISAATNRWYPRDVMRASKKCLAVPFKINADAVNGIMGGIVYLNRATVVGAGGSIITITDASSSLVITE